VKPDVDEITYLLRTHCTYIKPPGWRAEYQTPNEVTLFVIGETCEEYISKLLWQSIKGSIQYKQLGIAYLTLTNRNVFKQKKIFCVVSGTGQKNNT
jgi:hypothetical protein